MNADKVEYGCRKSRILAVSGIQDVDGKGAMLCWRSGMRAGFVRYCRTIPNTFRAVSKISVKRVEDTGGD